jgi:hypothetical protein
MKNINYRLTCVTLTITHDVSVLFLCYTHIKYDSTKKHNLRAQMVKFSFDNE